MLVARTMRGERVGACARRMLVTGAVTCCTWGLAAPAPATQSEPAAARPSAATAALPELELLEYLGGLATQGSQWIGPEDMATEEAEALQPAVTVVHGTRAGSVDEKTAEPSSEVQDNDE